MYTEEKKQQQKTRKKLCRKDWIMYACVYDVVVTHSYYSFMSAVNAFQQAPSLQGRKLVIGWKSWELYKALLDVVELRTVTELFTIFIALVTKNCQLFPYCSMSLALQLVAHRLPHTVSCVCTLSSSIQHSILGIILFSQIFKTPFSWAIA